MFILTFFIFVFGFATVVLSTVVAVSFYRHQRALNGNSRKLSTAISWQLIGEAIIGAGTLVFAAAAHYGVLFDWSIVIHSGIRFIMFFATAATTLHLYETIRKIKKSNH